MTHLDVATPPRIRPRPDPIPERRRSHWTRHAPWIGALATVLAAAFLADDRTRGLLACGAGAMAIVGGAARASALRTLKAVHIAGGVIALALWHGPEAAGRFAVAAATVLVGALLAHAAAADVRGSVAPLAGRLPWRFRAEYRGMALQFGVVGLAVGIIVALLGRDPALRIVAVALFPLALRTFVGHLLSREVMQTIWIGAVAANLAILVAFLPAFGGQAAAWALVAAETILFAAAALVIARRTGVTPFTGRRLGVVIAVVILAACVMVPSPTDWVLLVSIGGGVIFGAIFFPRRG